MMSLLVFLVILFGLFGIVVTQYISQYRRAYEIWVNEVVFNNNKGNSEEKRDLCSQIESYSRELCEMNDLILAVTYMIYISIVLIGLIIVITLKIPDFQGITIDPIKLYGSFFLLIMIFIAIPCFLSRLKIFIFKPSGSSSIDNMLFSVWWKNKCHRSKNISYQKNTQPTQLYEFLAENIENGTIEDATEDEIKLVEHLFKKNKFCSNA